MMKTTARNMHDGEGIVIADYVSAFKKLRATICNYGKRGELSPGIRLLSG